MAHDPTGQPGVAPDRARRLDAVVRGRVQGVGFRAFVTRRARDLHLRGWVRNEPDGSVRCVAEGPDAALARLVEVLRTGPPGARVDHVETTFDAPREEPDGFGVRAGGHQGD